MDFQRTRPLPGWTQEIPQGPSTSNSTPTVIRASHVTDLRKWLNQYENNHPPFTQGVDSKCYDPSDGRLPMISTASGNDWTGNIAELSPVGHPLYARLRITAPLDPSHTGGSTIDLRNNAPPGINDYASYTSTFAQYQARNMQLFPTFTLSFYKPYGYNLTESLEDNHSSPNYFTNSYTRGFSQRVVQFMQYAISHSSNVNDLIVWNEPNSLPPEGNEEYMLAKYFAALLFSTWNSIESATFTNPNGSPANRPHVYWGGIFTRRDEHTSCQMDYLQEVFNEIISSNVMDGKSDNFPWYGINIHMHRVRTRNGNPDSSLVHTFLKDATKFQTDKRDDGVFIIGEWGVTQSDGIAAMSNLYGQIRYGQIRQTDYPTSIISPEVMFYFSHHDWNEPGTGLWGLEHIDILPTTPTGDWKFTLIDKISGMWDRFKSIMNPSSS